jgi:hypothetical protein
VIHRILVAVDFSQSSPAAARWATTHFGHGAELELAHVAERPEVPHASRALSGLAETLRARRISVQVLEGPRVPALAGRALASRAELVVLLVPSSVTASSGTRDAVEAMMEPSWGTVVDRWKGATL